MYLNRGFVSIELPTKMAEDLKDIDWRQFKILDNVLFPNLDHPGENENGHYLNITHSTLSSGLHRM